MVLAVADRHRALLNDDIVRSHVEDHADLSPFLREEEFWENQNNGLNISEFLAW